MKKITLAVGSFILGLGVALPVGVFADDIKNVIGTKITGQYTVSVNGQKLSDPAIVAEGRSYAPVRSLVSAVGTGEIIVDNTEKTIDITVEPDQNQPVETTVPSENEYASMSVTEVKKKRDYLTESVIPQTEAAIANFEKELSDPNSLINKDYLNSKISEAKQNLSKYQAAVDQMNEVLEK